MVTLVRTDVDLPWERTDKAQILKKKLAYNTKEVLVEFLLRPL